MDKKPGSDELLLYFVDAGLRKILLLLPIPEDDKERSVVLNGISIPFKPIAYIHEKKNVI